MKKLLLPVALLSSGLAFVGSANAATSGATLDVSAVIINACTVGTSPVIFGTVVSGATVTSTGSIDVTCDFGISYDIALDGGLNPAATRQMIGPLAVPQAYTLRDGVTDWGDGGTFGAVVTGTGTGALVSHTVNAGMTAGATADTYSDTVNVTVTY